MVAWDIAAPGHMFNWNLTNLLKVWISAFLDLWPHIA